MSNSPHNSRRSQKLSLFSNKFIRRTTYSCLLMLASAVVVHAQARYQDISNGYRATFNPGVDVQMIFAGFSVFK